MKLENKTILITGGTSGIGWALGKALLNKNNKVVLLGRNKEALKQAKQAGFGTIECDLSKQEDIDKAVLSIQENYPDLDVLFNNAGLQFNYQFSEESSPVTKIKQEIAVNVTGQIILTQLLIPVMMNSRNGLIVNTTSGLAYFPKSDGLVYSATKAAMQNFTVGLRHALKPYAIEVVELIPPVTDTHMTAGRSEDKMSVDDLVPKIITQIDRGKKVATITKLRLFKWIAFFFPGLAHKILSK